jgi:hypothetical protein
VRDVFRHIWFAIPTCRDESRYAVAGVRWMWSILWSGFNSMETIQVVLDRKLLQAADRAARRTRQNRSALIRDALRQHLRALEVRELEVRDREGYARLPQSNEELASWEAEATWPAE